ncbi:hypothetical protein BRADI_4g43102v3 [Brachypodium distachyon]|uniref:Uncharacterized protein n=1 Tax=Brachypodium distachyon TaxID=15368 RepID=I1IUJ5_BRADI|nr:hypothetical protein BRADI_4g43102v3 [Brachypodium distachyon]
MSSSGGMTGSGEDVQRGDSKSDDSSSDTSVSSATSGRGRRKGKGKTVSLRDFHSRQHGVQSAVSSPSRQTPTASPTQPRPNLNSSQEYPFLGALSGSAADPRQLDQQKAREELVLDDRVARLKALKISWKSSPGKAVQGWLLRTTG